MSRQLVLPQGETAEGIFEYLRSFAPVENPNASVGEHERRLREMENYLAGDFRRFLYTLQCVPEGKGRLLEIGANPYFTTRLLRRYRQHELTLANGFGDGSAAVQTDRLVSQSGETEQFDYYEVNIEVDSELPFEPETFDVVMCCEVIEHMTNDPSRALAWLNSCLKQGGTLILTTPNAARWSNVLQLALGRNIYGTFSAYGPYGRHNREYTPDEMSRLLELGGFAVTDHFTADAPPFGGKNRTASRQAVISVASAAISTLRRKAGTLGMYMFFVAQKVGEPNARKPAWLYNSYPEAEVVR